MAKRVTWYFDFISPFAYLQSHRLSELPGDVDLAPTPILFAGLLNHWGQKGPAEIEAKRIFSFRHAAWRAKQAGIPYQLPPAHPFNPLRALRLSQALACDLNAVRNIFNAIWCDGHLPDDDDGWSAIQQAAGAANGDERITDTDVKEALTANGEAAIEAGVFGVPSFVVDGEVFWGDDSLDFVIGYLNDPSILAEDNMERVRDLPATARRVWGDGPMAKVKSESD